MHLVNKEPDTKNALSKAIKKVIGGKDSRSLYTTNPLLLKIPTKPKRKVLLEVKSTPKKERMRQYGDKGYRPSDGIGVGP